MSTGQSHRIAAVGSPLGEDVLLLQRLSAREEMGRLFEINLDLQSEDDAVSFDDLLGQGMTVRVECENGTRYWNGIVNHFSQVGQHRNLVLYRATLVPWFWLLSRHADCKIFQSMTVPDIIKQVFGDSGFTDYQDKLSGTYREWEYCVQYRETVFNFVSRLMEQEGIYYYFVHSNGKHELVLADGYSSHGTFPDYEQVPFFPPDAHQRRERDHIFEWSVSKQVRTATYVLDSYDFERPRADLSVTSEISRAHANSASEYYDYPGEYIQTADGDNYVQARIQEQQAGYERAYGAGTARGLVSGGLFSLDGHPRADQNREYLIVATTAQYQSNEYETDQGADAAFHCSVEAIEAKTPFRAGRKTPKPTVQGPQTAVVVGKSGEEIYTDKYGRVKVQFHWDRYGKLDENSSCWVRVAQVWAGKTWGTIHTPRIGQEVVVDFLEGDPDRPIVTGRVYNADMMPPYELPANQTQSGIKTRSTKGGTAETFNELRFEDKKGEEQIYFHAEKNFDRVVENNDTLKVGFEAKDKGDQTIEIHNAQTMTLFEGDQTITLKKGSRATTIETDDTLTVNSGDQVMTIKSGDQTVKISAGKNVTEAAKSILLKVGGSSIKIEPAAITIKSTKIAISGTASLDMKAANTTCKGSAMLTLKGGMTMIN